MTMKTKEIDETLRDGGYLVDVVFHKVGTNITISPDVLGIEIGNNEELKSFFDQFVRNTQLSWLGRNNTHIRKAESIAKSVHNRKIKDSLDGKHYIPKSNLLGYKNFLREKKVEYYAVRDQLVDSYELDVRRFRRKLENDFLSETMDDETQRGKMIEAIMEKVPSEEEVYDSFKIEESYMLFAMMTEMLDDEDKESAIESANIRMSRINGNTLAVVYDKLNTIITAIVESRHTKRHESMLLETVQEIDTRNIFSHSGIVDLKRGLESLPAKPDLTDFEVVVGGLYRLALDLKEEHQINLSKSVFTLNQLEFLAKM